MVWHKRLSGLDAEALGQHGTESFDLHLAESRERRDAPAQVGAVGGLGPYAFGAASVFIVDDRGELLYPLCHRSREAVDRGLLTEQPLELRRIRPCDLASVEGPEPPLQLPRAGERRLYRYLLVEREADEESERFARQQGVRLVIARVMECGRLRFRLGGQALDPRSSQILSASLSAIASVVRCVFARGRDGITEASAT
jgi:hypothetical protein